MSFEIKRARGKTAVFSGTRHHCDYIPRLEDLCIQKLIDNANKIECIGDVPYYILRPLLTKISLAQLKHIESHNPQLIVDPDSDEPWKVHCQRHFENRIPNRNETWRSLFKRCERERDHKIEKIAKRIKKHGEKSTPVRQAQFVEHQLPGGSNSRATSSTTVITKTIKNHIPISNPKPSSSGKTSTSTTIKTVVIKHNGLPGSGAKAKSKTAPLMLKSKQLFKNRFRR